MKNVVAFVTSLALAWGIGHTPVASAAGGVVGTGTPNSCTELAFDAVFFNAQSSGGGVISFNCGAAAHAIVFGAYKPVSTNTEIKGGDLITLSGGNSAGLFQVFVSGSLTLGNVTITRGFGQFGAIENLGVLTVVNSRLETNTSTVSGGALTNHGKATLINVVISGNTASQNGGGIASDGGTLNIANSQVTRNIAGKRGGGLDIAPGAVATVETSRFLDNQSLDGGGIGNAGTLALTDTSFAHNVGNALGGALYAASGSATVTRGLFIFNWAAGGGAIHHLNGALTLNQTMLVGNGFDDASELTVAVSGGAIRQDGGTAVLTDITVFGNRAESGGGLANLGGTATLTNVTFANNRAALYAGAIDMTGGTVSITNATITDNSGGGISRRAGTLTVKNTAFANSGSANCTPALTSATFSLSSDSTCSLGVGRDNIAMDFGVLAFNGGFTLTRLPLPGNPVIDNGTGIGCPSTDQRGVPRPAGLACDVGAVEYVAGAPDVGAVVEYFHAGFGHYFVSLSLEDILRLDAGLIVGWARTGERFSVYRSAGTNLAAVCRFFTVAFPPKSSHFYAPRGLGCEGTMQNDNWIFEGDVFFSPLPAANGTCPAGHLPVYRLYNNGQGGAPNHRFTTNPTIRTQMIASGYVPEGAGIGVGMCSPQ